MDRDLTEGNAVEKRPLPLITGVLGGLGSRTAELLLDQGFEVFGVDNLDPGSAPAAHAKERLASLGALAGFHFLPLDLRAPDAGARIRDALLPAVVLHAAGLEPWRRAPADLDSLGGDLLQMSEALISLASGDTFPLVLPLHEPLVEDDPRGDHPAWRELLAAESRLVERLASSYPGEIRAAALPTLWGRGQSPFSFPLHALWQAASRLPSTLPPDRGAVRTLPLEAAARHLVELALTEETALPPPPAPLPVNARDLSDVLLEESGIAPVGSEVGELPWSAPAGTDPSAEETAAMRREARGLARWARSLPHFPPPDWPRGGRGRRKRR